MNLSFIIQREQVQPAIVKEPPGVGFDALVARLGVRPRIVAEVDDMAMMRLLAREDVGLAGLPPIVVKDELEQGSLIEATDRPASARHSTPARSTGALLTRCFSG